MANAHLGAWRCRLNEECKESKYEECLTEVYKYVSMHDHRKNTKVCCQTQKCNIKKQKCVVKYKSVRQHLNSIDRFFTVMKKDTNINFSRVV